MKHAPDGTDHSLAVLRDQITLPAALIRQSALDNNLKWMASLAEHQGLSLAPHGKTTMSPEIIGLQISHGAWGITAATPGHARHYAAWGVPRIIVANQVVGAANLGDYCGLLETNTDIEVYCLVDSVAGVQALDQAAAQRPNPPRCRVLLEVGALGRRAGVRTLDEAIAVAEACRNAKNIALAGVEVFEGVHSDDADVDRQLAHFAQIFGELENKHLIEADEFIVTAGGSMFFDQAARTMLDLIKSKPVRPVLRSGCYVTHDHGMYARTYAAVNERRVLDLPNGKLIPALEVWAHIQSRPEPGRAIASLGKRNISSDVEMPLPLKWARPGKDNSPKPLEGAEVDMLFDQHACLSIPKDSELRVGDLIGFGISHPCTTFDKWRCLHLVDDNYVVTGAVTTQFG